MWKTPTILVLIVLLLLGFGIVMLASTSVAKAIELYNQPHFFVKRQFLWLSLALMAGFVAAHIDYHRWRSLALPLYGVVLVLLALVFVPGIGVNVNGSRRWLRLFGVLSIQPSEVAKFALILSQAWWLARKQRQVQRLIKGTVVPLLFMSGLALLIFAEPDFGTTMLCAAVGLAMMFVAGSRVAYLAAFAVVGLSGFIALVLHNEVRRMRILAFLDPDKYAQTFAYQLKAALSAFYLGGGVGVGLGQSMQKHAYLPEAHTDFIFAIIGEELGLIATLTTLGLFAAFFGCGMRISMKAPDVFGRLLAFGLTLMITLQAIINIAVVTGCMPTKGLPLPFISFGGSSLVISMLGVGVLVNIAQHAVGAIRDEDTRVVRDRLHEF